MGIVLNVLLTQPSSFVRCHRCGCERGMDVRQAANLGATTGSQTEFVVLTNEL